MSSKKGNSRNCQKKKKKKKKRDSQPFNLLRSNWDQGQNHLYNMGCNYGNEQVKYTVGLIYKTIIKYFSDYVITTKQN